MAAKASLRQNLQLVGVCSGAGAAITAAAATRAPPSRARPSARREPRRSAPAPPAEPLHLGLTLRHRPDRGRSANFRRARGRSPPRRAGRSRARRPAHGALLPRSVRSRSSPRGGIRTSSRQDGGARAPVRPPATRRPPAGARAGVLEAVAHVEADAAGSGHSRRQPVAAREAARAHIDAERRLAVPTRATRRRPRCRRRSSVRAGPGSDPPPPRGLIVDAAPRGASRRRLRRPRGRARSRRGACGVSWSEVIVPSTPASGPRAAYELQRQRTTNERESRRRARAGWQRARFRGRIVSDGDDAKRRSPRWSARLPPRGRRRIGTRGGREEAAVDARSAAGTATGARRATRRAQGRVLSDG